MGDPVTIALDAMGGDHGPSVVIPAAAIALVRHPNTRFILVGDRDQIAAELKNHTELAAKSEIVHSDIAIAMDVSASMLARDFSPDRLEAAKAVAMQFIDRRPNDRIGLVVYEGEAFTQCPLTTDHDVLKDLFAQVRSGLIEGGTAVGMGLATAVNRLRESEAKSRVIILLTDGVNNAGNVQPVDAAQIAAQFGIRVYTIGVGTRGKALSPVARYPNGKYRYDHVDVEIDEEMLQEVAARTDGRYFRATDEAKLRAIYAEIDQLEKTRIKVTEHSRRNEEYFPLALAGSGLLLLGLLLDRSLFRTTP